MLTLESFKAEMAPFHNDICVVHDCKLARLVGLAESDDDFYYKVVELGGRISYCSAVGACVSLKATYPDPERYATMDNSFSLNRAAPTDTFTVEKI